MRVAEIMSTDVARVSPLTTVEQAAGMMRDLEIGALPVATDGELVGIITDRDIVVRGVAENLEGMFSRVSDLMTCEVFTCLDDDEVEAAAAAMTRLRVRRLPVLDAEGRLVGIVSLSDIAAHREETAARAPGKTRTPMIKVMA